MIHLKEKVHVLKRTTVPFWLCAMAGWIHTMIYEVWEIFFTSPIKRQNFALMSLKHTFQTLPIKISHSQLGYEASSFVRKMYLGFFLGIVQRGARPYVLLIFDYFLIIFFF